MKFDHACRGLMGINRDKKSLVGKFEFSISRNFPQLPIQKKKHQSQSKIFQKLIKFQLTIKLKKGNFPLHQHTPNPEKKAPPKSCLENHTQKIIETGNREFSILKAYFVEKHEKKKNHEKQLNK